MITFKHKIKYLQAWHKATGLRKYELRIKPLEEKECEKVMECLEAMIEFYSRLVKLDVHGLSAAMTTANHGRATIYFQKEKKLSEASQRILGVLIERQILLQNNPGSKTDFMLVQNMVHDLEQLGENGYKGGGQFLAHYRVGLLVPKETLFS